MRYWLKILRDGKGFGTLFFLSFVIITSGLLSPIFIIHIFNRYITFGLEGTLLFLVFGALLVAVIEYNFRNIRDSFCSKIIRKPIKELKLSILKTFFESEVLKNKSFKNNNLNTIIDVNNNILQVLNPNNQSNILDSLFAILIIFILFFLNYTLASIFTTILFITLIIQTSFYNKKLVFITKNFEKPKEYTQLFDDLKNKTFFLKSLNIFKFIGFKFASVVNRQFDDNNYLTQSANHQMNLNHFIMLINTIVIIGIGSTYVVNGDLTIGTLIGFNIFSARALQISINAQKSFYNFKNVSKYFLIINDFFRVNSIKKIGLKLNKFNDCIEIRNLDFNYENNSSFLLKNQSLILKIGELTTISGKNGSGKSTLCKLILGLISPTSGEILIDKTNLKNLSASWWRDQIGFVPQNLRCLNISLIDNIRIGNDQLNESEISRLVNSVGLGDSIKKCNLTFNDTLNEDVSIGIHKKVHYSRMLSGNRSVIILDDPLENLDLEGRNFVINLIKSFKKAKKTVICFTNDHEILNLTDSKYNLDG